MTQQRSLPSIPCSNSSIVERFAEHYLKSYGPKLLLDQTL